MHAQIQHIWSKDRLDRSMISITEDRLRMLLRRYRAVIRSDTKDGFLYLIKTPNPRTTAFTWEPQIIRRVRHFEVTKTIKTMHSCGFYGFFKPSLAEVLAHVPADAHDYGNGFYIDLRQPLEILYDGEGHRATTHFGVIHF